MFFFIEFSCLRVRNYLFPITFPTTLFLLHGLTILGFVRKTRAILFASELSEREIPYVIAPSFGTGQLPFRLKQAIHAYYFVIFVIFIKHFFFSKKLIIMMKVQNVNILFVSKHPFSLFYNLFNNQNLAYFVQIINFEKSNMKQIA